MASNLLIVIGAYGSGKSEYAINLADRYNNQGEKVMLVDLDIVNPYFRSRDVRDYFAGRGIQVVAPEKEYSFADVPMLSPQIAGAVSQKDKVVILDVGGDPSGCRALGRYTEAIKERGYQMHFVVNTFRPFTGTTEDIVKMMDMLEYTSQLKVTELISNTNLLDETDSNIVLNGIKILNEVAKEKKKIFTKYLVIDNKKDSIRDRLDNKQRMILKYYLSKPWEQLP